MKSFFFTLILTSISSLAYAQDWELVYHNDTAGNQVEGTLAALISAVKNGKEVRIAWWSGLNEAGKPRVYHLADAAFLTIMSDSIVFAQIRPIAGQTPNLKEGTMTLKENLEWTCIGGTNGDFDSMMRHKVTGEIVGHGKRKSAFKWYIRK